jgi:hypothetical protein
MKLAVLAIIVFAFKYAKFSKYPENISDFIFGPLLDSFMYFATLSVFGFDASPFVSLAVFVGGIIGKLIKYMNGDNDYFE